MLGRRTLNRDPHLTIHPCRLGNLCLLLLELSVSSPSNLQHHHPQNIPLRLTASCFLISFLPCLLLPSYVLTYTGCQPWLVDLHLRAQTTTSVFFTNLTALSWEPCRQWDPKAMETDSNFRSDSLGITSVQPFMRPSACFASVAPPTSPKSRLQIMFLTSTQGLTIGQYIHFWLCF